MHSSNIWTYLSLALAASFTVSNAAIEVGINMERRQIGGLLSGFAPGSSDVVSSTTPVSSITTPIASSSTTPITTASTTSSVESSSTTSSILSTTPSSAPVTSAPSSSVPQTSETPTPIVTSVPRTTIIVTMTSNGQTFTSSSTDFSTSTSTPTGTPNTSGQSSGDGGIDNATKSKIIGATVGVGGAIILAGLGFVAWRLWGKKKNHADEDEILMAGSSAHGEKLTSSASNNPFKSNLEQYHAHSGTNF